MITLFEYRASTILFNFLLSNDIKKPFLLPSNICPIVPLTFLKAMIPFEFVDISLADFCMDQGLVLERLKDQPNTYGGVLYVRSYGLMNPSVDLFDQIKDLNKDLIIIDDRCLCVPGYDVELSSSVDLILYSTGKSKIIDLGFGGFAYMCAQFDYNKHQANFEYQDLERVTADYKKTIVNRAKFSYSDTDWLNNSEPSISFRNYQNLVEKIIGLTIERKERINQVYSQDLPKEIQFAPEQQTWRFNINVPGKTSLLDKIFSAKLWASSHYASLDGIFSDGRSSNAEKLHSGVVNLFNDRSFDIFKAKRITGIINQHLIDY